MDVLNGDTCTEDLCKDDINDCVYCNESYWDHASSQGITSLTKPEWEIATKTVGEIHLF